MKIKCLREHYEREIILNEQLSEEDLSELISNLEKMDRVLDSADIPEIDQKIDDAREFLSKVQSGQIKPGLFGLTGRGRQMRQQLNNVRNATVQIANLLQNMHRILTLSGKNLIGQMQKPGNVEQGDNVADVLNRIAPGASNRMRELIKSYLLPKFLKGKSAINADAAANQILALDFSQFQDFVRTSSAASLDNIQPVAKEDPEKEKTAAEKLLTKMGIGTEDGAKPGQENLKKVVQLLKKDKNMAKSFMSTLDVLKRSLGKDFTPEDLEIVYRALK